MKRLTENDKRVIWAWADARHLEGKNLSTDGHSLLGNWIGGKYIAIWRKDAIELPYPGSRAAQMVQREIKRMFGPEDKDGKMPGGRRYLNNPKGQPKWKLLWSTDYSAVFIDETGQYAPEMMIADEVFDAEEDTFVVFRFPLERLRKSGPRLVMEHIAESKSLPHPIESYDEWFTKSLADVARSIGSTKKELVEALTSNDIGARAWAYESIGRHHGFENLDSYPQTWSVEKMENDWPNG